MKHTMKKFSRGGAQGMYDRRMADIEKDRKIALAKGKNADVVEAKAAQRKADAEDDRAKRMGLDRTATRKAEYDAEQRLSRTRRFGADKPAAAAQPAATPAATPAAAATPEVAKAKPKTIRQEFNEAFSAARAKAVKEGRDPNKEIFMFGGKKKVALMAGSGSGKSTATTRTPAARPLAAAKNNPPATAASPAAAKNNLPADASTVNILQAARIAREKKEAEERKKRIGMPAYERMAKGGTVKKETTMKKKPMPMGGKQLMPLKKKLTKEPITGGSDTVPATSERNEFRKEMMKRNATPGMKKGGKMKKYAAGGLTKQMPTSKQMGDLNMAKGGKAKMKPAAKGKAKGKAKGNPFAATKFGAAMMKKSADTEGRAMKKFAKGGSIDGCAVRGKTKMAMGGMAGYKKGGKTC